MKDFKRKSFGGSRDGGRGERDSRGGDRFPRRETGGFGGGFSPRPSFGGRNAGAPRFGNGGNSGGNTRLEMHAAVCSSCGQACEVPFRPNGKKPVLCRNCFSKDQPAPFERGNDARPDFSRAQFAKPVEDKRIDDIKRQLDFLHAKIDRLTKALLDSGTVDTLDALEIPESAVPKKISTKGGSKTPKKFAKKTKKKK